MTRPGLPQVLVSPPWLQPAQAHRLEIAPPEARLDVPDDLRESWLERFPAPKRPRSLELDDGVLDRHVNALKRRQPPREVEVSWLTDGGLSDLLDEVGSRLSLKVAEYALARLGDKAIAPVSKAGLTESRLRPVLEYLFTPELVEMMAAILLRETVESIPADEMRERPYTPSECEAWLHRNGTDAVPVMLNLVWSEHDLEKAAARKVLSLLALTGVPVAEQADAAGLPYIDQPRWMQFEPMPDAPDWLPALIAQPKSAAVEALIEDLESPSVARNLARWRDAESPLAFEQRELGAFFDRWMDAHAELMKTALTDPSYRPLPPRPDPGEQLHVPQPPVPRPSFWDLATLPRPTLRDGTAVPDEAMEHFSTMLQHSPFDAPYRGLLEVIEACDPESLDDFAAALLSGYAAGGMDHANDWVVLQALRVGGEKTFAQVREMLAVAAGHADRAQSDRAKAWVRGYAALGTPAGLQAVQVLSEDPNPLVRNEAQAALDL